MNLPTVDGGFRCVVADPPWAVKAGPPLGGYKVVNGKQVWASMGKPTRDQPFPTLSTEELCQMPIGDITAKAAHLYLWTINSQIEAAFKIAKAWGFKFSTMLTWAKNPCGRLGGCYASTSEFILFCRKGSLSSIGSINTNWFNWKRAYDERGKPQHSRKPEAFYTMVENVSPGPYAELFARRARPNWVVWGNEAPKC